MKTKTNLELLAEQANTEHAAFETTQSAAVAHAIAAGEALIAAKAELERGQWLPWVRANLDFSERMARNYMRIARNGNAVADLGSIREALADLAEPRSVIELPQTVEAARLMDSNMLYQLEQLAAVARGELDVRAIPDNQLGPLSELADELAADPFAKLNALERTIVEQEDIAARARAERDALLAELAQTWGDR